MWAVMMVAMMTPSSSPMILMFSEMNRRRAEHQGPVVRTGIFVLGYLIAWAAYSAAAATAQWVLHGLALVSPMMVSTSPYLGGGLLVAAGIFQWTPLKRACLTQCRSPIGFIMTEWREGPRGALVMGLRHGVYCVGCCWVLMALLFVAGVMNLVWVAAIATFVLVEKLPGAGERVGRVAGVIMVLAGVALDDSRLTRRGGPDGPPKPRAARRGEAGTLREYCEAAAAPSCARAVTLAPGGGRWRRSPPGSRGRDG